MKVQIIAAAFSLGALSLLGACETIPVQQGMELESFEAAIKRVQDNPSAAAVNRDLTRLLAQPLTDDQKAQTYLLRAERRWKGNFDKPGAMTDLEAYLVLRPLDPGSEQVRTDQRMIQSEITRHEQQLSGLQTLPKWFDDKVALGAIDEAAARYKKSGLTPTDLQVYTLREAGFICTEAAGGDAIHKFGDVPAYAANLVWCPGKPIA